MSVCLSARTSVRGMELSDYVTAWDPTNQDAVLLAIKGSPLIGQGNRQQNVLIGQSKGTF